MTFGDGWGAEFHAAEHSQCNIGVTTGDPSVQEWMGINEILDKNTKTNPGIKAMREEKGSVKCGVESVECGM